MCFEKTLLTSREYGSMMHQLLPEFDGDGAQRWQASGPHGEILLSEIQDTDYSVWHIDLALQSDLTLTIQQVPPASSVGLAFTLKRNIPYFVNGLRSGIARRNHYNLMFVPESHCELNLKKGEYELFGVEFNPEYLRKLSNDDAPLFRDFVDELLEGRAASIVESHKMATTEIMDVVSELVYFRYPGKMRRLYIKSRVVDLLRLSVENISLEGKSGDGISAAEIKMVNTVKEYLLTNLDNPGTLKEISIRTGVNEFKLKRGFRKVFGKSVMSFVQEARLTLAKEMITNSDSPLKAIAMRAGYRNISNFTTAFRKHFGYSPGTLKRGSSGEKPVD